MSQTARVLVVANRTVESAELLAALHRRAARSPAAFTLLVPAVPHGLAWVTDMKAGAPAARPRAEAGARRLRMSGLEVEAALVGDPDPFAAVGDTLRAGRFDEVMVCTLPRGFSRWLRMSLPHRLRRATELPVTHVTGHPREVRRRSAPRRPAEAARA